MYQQIGALTTGCFVIGVFVGLFLTLGLKKTVEQRMRASTLISATVAGLLMLISMLVIALACKQPLQPTPIILASLLAIFAGAIGGMLGAGAVIMTET